MKLLNAAKRLLVRTIIFFGAFMVYHIVFSNFFPVDENNVLIAPDWYEYFGLIVAVSASWWKEIRAKITGMARKRKKSVVPPVEPVIPDRTASETTVIEIPQPIKLAPQYTPSEIDLVDAMEGHAFEYWCADLLRKNGFANVTVTRGSGDQGVDVLAEKDGVRYAIQCKCYSHDLGNTPVQEVHAGKIIYHCHIGAVMTNRYFTKGAKEAAEATGVLLWDRDWIKAHLKDAQDTESHTSRDPLLWSALDLIHSKNSASVSVVQDGLGVGYARAARIIDRLEELGYIGPFRGSTPREILK